MLRTASSLPPKGLLTLGSGPARFQTTPAGDDELTNRTIRCYVTASPPALLGARRVGGWRGGSLAVGPGAFMFRRFPGRLRHPSAPGQVCSVSSPRRLEPCVRFSRTRLTDAVHRRHSAFPARACPPWVRRRFHTS